mmetsp:Transcript_17817/g.58284  ORF Transcript_17817/g.58284 Transcript_17817/m.58284 type:complete len:233 (-) Transcript_17817:188-886(-)
MRFRTEELAEAYGSSWHGIGRLRCKRLKGFMACGQIHPSLLDRGRFGAVEDAAHFTDVDPRERLWALRLSRGVSEEVRGMEHWHEEARAREPELPRRRKPSSAEGGNAAPAELLRREQRPHRVPPAQDHRPRPYELQLRQQKLAVKLNLRRGWVPVRERAAPDDVGDVDIRFTVEADAREDLVEELPRAPDEGLARAVLLCARAFAHHHQPRRWASAVTHDSPAVRLERVPL